MTRRVQVEADLEVTVELPDGETARGSLRGQGNRLVFEVDRPELFTSRADAAPLVAAAELLHRRGVRVDVVHRGTVLLTVGAVRAPWWHRRLTGSHHIRMGGWRSVLVPGRARLRPTRTGDGVLPGAGLLPPPTLFPLVPTFQGAGRTPVTTTDDPARGGRPRLVLGAGDRDEGVTPERRVYWLRDGVTTIGSAEGCDLRFEGLEALHAEVLHDVDDELVVLAYAPGVRVNGVQVNGSPGPGTAGSGSSGVRAPRHVLRTGARVQVGDWVLAYARDEFADHGRPYGGRIGGEFGHQRTQPPPSVPANPPDE